MRGSWIHSKYCTTSRKLFMNIMWLQIAETVNKYAIRRMYMLLECCIIVKKTAIKQYLEYCFVYTFLKQLLHFTRPFQLILFSIQFFFNFFHQAKKCQQFRNLFGSTRHRNVESSNENIINFAHCTTIKRNLKRYSIRIRRSNVTDFRFLKTALFCQTSVVSLSHLLP